jgi:hypothetical protein
MKDHMKAAGLTVLEGLAEGIGTGYDFVADHTARPVKRHFRQNFAEMQAEKHAAVCPAAKGNRFSGSDKCSDCEQLDKWAQDPQAYIGGGTRPIKPKLTWWKKYDFAPSPTARLMRLNLEQLVALAKELGVEHYSTIDSRATIVRRIEWNYYRAFLVQDEQERKDAVVKYVLPVNKMTGTNWTLAAAHAEDILERPNSPKAQEVAEAKEKRSKSLIPPKLRRNKADVVEDTPETVDA